MAKTGRQLKMLARMGRNWSPFALMEEIKLYSYLGKYFDISKIYLKISLVERQSNGARWQNHPLGSLQKCSQELSLDPDQSQEAETLCESPTWMAVTPALGMSSTAFPGALAESFMRRRGARTLVWNAGMPGLTAS